MSNIGYHTRLASDNTRKIVGGSFDGAIDMDTVNRLVSSQFTIAFKNRHPYFVDSAGRQVTLYISVDVRATTKGQEAIKAERAEREKEYSAARVITEKQQQEIEELMNSLSNEEIIKRLKP